MKQIELFIDALNILYPDVQFIPRLSITPAPTYPAYKVFTLEIYLVKGETKSIISTVKNTQRVINDSQAEVVKDDLAVKTMVQLINYCKNETI